MNLRNSLRQFTVREILLLFIIVSIGIFYIDYIWVNTKKEQSQQALQVALSVEKILSFEDIQLLSANPADTAKAVYKTTKEKLQSVIQVNPKARFAYLYQLRNGKLYFMVDSEPQNSPYISPPGQEFTEADEIDFQLFKTGKAQVTQPVTDRWGTWVSIEVPIINKATGEIIAAFGMDYEASSWSNTLIVHVLELSVLVLLSLILYVAIRISLIKNKSLENEIHERESAENKLKKLSRAVEQNPVSIIITDAQGLIEYVNPKFTEITGYSFDEAVGQNPRILKSGEMDNEFYSDLWNTITSGGIWKGEIRNRRKSGELYWVNKTISPILDCKGNIQNYVSIGEDVTEKKKNEAELIKAKEKAEESDRLKSSFLANISHEIRTPMNGLLGFADLLKSPDLSPENQKEFLNMIEKSGLRMLNIINDLIDMSKIEAGETSLRIKKTSINKMLHELHIFFIRESKQKNIYLDYHCDLPEEESYIETDSTKLSQVLINLIKNAVKFTDEGSVVFGYKQKDSMFEFFVVDSGPGIPTEQLDLIFERFRQSTLNLTRKYEGAGLGLAISKAYVELLGGTIGLKSEPGKGSTFFFSLPLSHPSAN